MWQNVSKEVEHALIGSKTLEYFNTFLGVNFGSVLDCNLGNNLNILSWVGLEHIVHALEAFLFTKLSEEINDLLLWNGMGIEHDSLNVSHVGVALESSTIETNLLAHLGNSFSVILSEQVELEDSLSYVWCAHEIDLEDFGLEMSLIGSVALKSL